jgi:hypothetical protein
VAKGQAFFAGWAAEADDRQCDFGRVAPCVNGPGDLSVDTARLSDGPHPLAVVAEDSARNRGFSQVITARVDNTPPPRVDVAADGGEGWRSTPGLALTWTNPDEGDRAPITAAHYRLCKSGTSECTPGRVAGDGIARLGVAAPAPGAYDVTIFREDAAGNSQSDNASVPLKLRYDPEAPQAAFEALSATDPTRVSVAVADRVSGVAGGAIEISRQGSGSWQPLATQLEGDRLVARIDDSRLEAGTYSVRAHAVDQAGNRVTTDRLASGEPVTITLPLRVASRMRAGVAVRKTVHHPRQPSQGALRPRRADRGPADQRRRAGHRRSADPGPLQHPHERRADRRDADHRSRRALRLSSARERIENAAVRLCG